MSYPQHSETTDTTISSTDLAAVRDAALQIAARELVANGVSPSELPGAKDARWKRKIADAIEADTPRPDGWSLTVTPTLTRAVYETDWTLAFALTLEGPWGHPDETRFSITAMQYADYLKTIGVTLADCRAKRAEIAEREARP